MARFAINYYRHPPAKERTDRKRERGMGGNFANTSFFGDEEIDKIGKKE